MLIRLLALFTVFTTLQLGGCAVFRDRQVPAEATPMAAAPLDLIARDFVGALQQMPSLAPADTTVDMQRSDRDDGFTVAMLHALEQSGYGIRWVSGDGSASLFQYRQVTREAAASARHDTYELAIGAIELRREYVSDGQRVRPLSALYVRGTDASGIVPVDSLFDNDMQGRQVSTLASNINPRELTMDREATGAAPSWPLADRPIVENVFDIGASNFADSLANRDVVAEHVLVFGNDSLRLGTRNKQQIHQMVERFDPKTDVFSVIGCSMGPTQVAGGNAALALGRAGRVVEALRFAGVEDSRILDEGCWAGSGRLDNLPHRGVVLSLNRQR